MQHTPFRRCKFLIRIKKTRSTNIGTLRISHTSSSHSLTGERANKLQSFENAKLHRELQIPTWEKQSWNSSKASYFLVQDLVTQHPRASQLFSMWPRVFAFVRIWIIKFVRDRVFCVSPPIHQARLMLVLASFDKLWKFTARFNIHILSLGWKLKAIENGNFKKPIWRL